MITTTTYLADPIGDKCPKPVTLEIVDQIPRLDLAEQDELFERLDADDLADQQAGYAGQDDDLEDADAGETSHDEEPSDSYDFWGS